MSVLPFRRRPTDRPDRTPEARKLKKMLGTTMLRDGGYTPAERCVGMFIIDHWNERRGYAYPPIEYIAATLKLSERVVRLAVEQFRKPDCPYFEVEKTGRNYIYKFKPKTPADCAGIDTGKKRGKYRQKTTRTPADCAAHPLDNPIHPSLGHESDPKIGAKATALPSGSTAATEWSKVSARLTEHLGPDVTQSWFRNAAIVRIVDGVGTLAAPSRFIRNWVRQHYADHLLKAWRSVNASVTRVEIILRAEA